MSGEKSAKKRPMIGNAWAVIAKRDRRIGTDAICTSLSDAKFLRNEWDDAWPERGPHRVAKVRITEIGGSSDED